MINYIYSSIYSESNNSTAVTNTNNNNTTPASNNQSTGSSGTSSGNNSLHSSNNSVNNQVNNASGNHQSSLNNSNESTVNNVNNQSSDQQQQQQQQSSQSSPVNNQNNDPVNNQNALSQSNNNSGNNNNNSGGVSRVIQMDTPTSGICTVTISSFSSYKESFYTGIFNLCKSNWRLLIFPEGNNSPGNISIFLDYYDIGTNPLYQKEAQLSLTLMNQLDSNKSVKKNSSHIFSFKGVNWGFISFLPLSQLLNPNSGFLVNDQLKIRVEINSPGTIDKSDPNDIKPYGKFSYTLTNVSHHFENFYSPSYYVCGSNWRIYIFPNGYSSPNYFSVYLDLLDVKFKPLLVKHLFFAIEIVNQKNPEKNLKKWVDHVFDDKNMNFGFPKFVLLSTLLNQDLGYIVDDCIIINIEFTVMSSNFSEPSPNFDIEYNLKNNNLDCGRFTYHAKKQPNLDLLFSPTFKLAGSHWQIVSYPLENLTDYFSIYLDLVDIKTKPLLRKHISFAIEIVNQENPSKNFKKYISNIYSYSSFSWLFQKFMKQSTLYKPENGFFKNGEVIINVEFIVIASDFLRPISTPNLLAPPMFNINNLSIQASINQMKEQNQLSLPGNIMNHGSGSLDHLSNNGSSGSGGSSGSLNNQNSSDQSPQNNIFEHQSIFDDGLLNRGERSGSFSLTMENFLALDKSFYSQVFTLHDTKWRFYVFPKGNQASGFFSLYLDYVDPKSKPKIRQYICFVLEVVNKDKKKSESKYSFHTFCYSSVNWGFKKFLPLETIKKEESGFLDNGALTVSVTIFFLSQSLLDNDHLLSYSRETSKHIQLYTKNHNNDSIFGQNTGGSLSVVGQNSVAKFSDDAALNEQLKKQKADEEAFYYHTIKLTFDADYEGYNGFDLIDFKKHIPIKIRKISTLLEIKLQIQMLYGIAFERQRFWFWDPSPNKISRVTRCPMVLDDEDIFNQYLTLHSQHEIRFHLEISNAPGPNEKNLFFDQVNNDSVMVFFKHYDPRNSELSYITSKVCNINQPVSSFIPLLNQKLGYPLQTPLMLFGEDSLNVVYCLDPHKSLKYHELGNGSMIICQRHLSLNDRHYKFPFLIDYFNFTFNKLVVTFNLLHYKNINTRMDLTLRMEILKGMKYQEIVKRLSEIFQTFPQNVILYSVDKSEPNQSKKVINPISLGDKSVYDTLSSQQRKVDLIYIELKETIPPIQYLSSLGNSKIFPVSINN